MVMNYAGKRIGILGGSFNPAHRGHLHVSREAIRLLLVDEIWWMVSPQNPLKPIEGMAAIEDRIEAAISFVHDNRIKVTGIETELETNYTADTLTKLSLLYPRAKFVWLMGADNLIQISRWKDWERIFKTVPIAVFTRPSYTQRALTGYAAKRFARYKIDERMVSRLADMKAPAWSFLNIQPDPTSATKVRSGLGTINIFQK
ncbi:MAG: nicotinate-nucleotide adenylyltransferase [Pseudomonadota bacterium]|nr:nicotinate-nucleotide adenylyltransferase [Pseudomonadota bacterium]